MAKVNSREVFIAEYVGIRERILGTIDRIREHAENLPDASEAPNDPKSAAPIISSLEYELQIARNELESMAGIIKQFKPFDS